MPTTLPLGRWSSEVHVGLTELLAGPRGDAVFDWDDTILEGDSSIAWLEHLDAIQGTRWTSTYWRTLEREGRGAAYVLPAIWLAGWRSERVRRVAARVIADALATQRLRFRPDVCELIGALHSRGWRVWVISASPSELIRTMAPRVGIDPMRVLGMQTATGDDGRYLDIFDRPATVGPGKRQTLLDNLPDTPRLVVGDSPSDLDMLEIAELALLIDGHHEELRVTARERGWLVQSGWPHSPAEHVSDPR